MLVLKEDRLSRPLQLKQTTAWDGQPLFFTLEAKEPAPKKALVVFTSVLEQARPKFDVHASQDYSIFSWIPRELNQATSANTYLKDALSFVDAIRRQHNIAIENMVFLACKETRVLVRALIEYYTLSPRGNLSWGKSPLANKKLSSPSVFKINNPIDGPLMINENYISILNGLKRMELLLGFPSEPVLQSDGSEKDINSDQLTNLLDSHFASEAGAAYLPRPAMPYFPRRMLNPLNRDLYLARKYGLNSKTFYAALENQPGLFRKLSPMLNSIRVHVNHQRLVLNHIINRCLMEKDSANILDLSVNDAHTPLDVIARYESTKVHGIIVNQDEHNLLDQQIECMSRGFNQFQFNCSNPFEAEQVKFLAQADIVCAYGINEKIHFEQQLLRVFQSFNQTLREGGYLLFTNQLHHPVSEKLLPLTADNDGGVLRSQRELYRVLHWAGFSLHKIYLDEENMFSVNVAIKLPSKGKK